jgi:serine O-acetyltransferase
MDPVIVLYRIAHWLKKMHIPVLPTLCYLLNRLIFSVVLPPETRVGKQVKFAYLGLGTVVHRNAVIGNNVYVGPGVTIGGRSGYAVLPVIEDDVFIGAGARVLGPLTVGRNSVVGANAVVVADVPANSVVAGIPAKVIKRDIAPGAFR